MRTNPTNKVNALKSCRINFKVVTFLRVRFDLLWYSCKREEYLSFTTEEQIGRQVLRETLARMWSRVARNVMEVTNWVCLVLDNADTFAI